ncbi:MAG: hypothetical protein AB1813_21780 [Verrucomicrobiota bacterium]
MTTPTCPKCSRAIERDDVNVAIDVAYCRPCNISHRLSKLTFSVDLDEGVDPNRPPPGAWRHKQGSGLVIGATHRSIGSAVLLLGFALFWNGILSIFVALALSSTLRLLGLPAPTWFPQPIMNDKTMTVGVTLFLWLFLTPFLIIGAALFLAFLSCLGGRTEIRLNNSEGVIFTGIGPLGYKRRFNRASVSGIRIDEREWRNSDQGGHRRAHIVIEATGRKPIHFGSSLSDERRKFLASLLRRELGL